MSGIGPTENEPILIPIPFQLAHVENTPWQNTHQERALLSMEIRDILAHNLRHYRQAKGLSQEELAHRADLDRTYISALERCVYAASVDVVGRLAKVLDIPAFELLRGPKDNASE